MQDRSPPIDETGLGSRAPPKDETQPPDQYCDLSPDPDCAARLVAPEGPHARSIYRWTRRIHDAWARSGSDEQRRRIATPAPQRTLEHLNGVTEFTMSALCRMNYGRLASCQTTFASTFVPATICSGSAHSAGLCEMPPRQGMKIIPVGQT